MTLPAAPCRPACPRGALRDALLAYARAQADAGQLDSMSLRAAARALGVSSGAVYRHFEDRDQLLKAVAHQGFQEIGARLGAICPDAHPAQAPAQAVARAFALGRAFVGFAAANPGLWRTMFGRAGSSCACDGPAERATCCTLRDCCLRNARELHRLGAIPAAPTEADIRFLWNAVHGAADLAQSGLDQGRCGAREIADQTTERALRALGAPLALIAEGRDAPA